MTMSQAQVQAMIDDQTTRFDAIKSMVQMTAEGTNRSLIVSGGPGTGKTFTIENVVTASGAEYKIVKGYMRATALYALLYEMRAANQVLVFDDCDQVFRDEVGLNILKGALDSSERRVIDWRTKAPMKNEDGEAIPNSFEYKGSVIFITNIDFDAEIAKGGKLAPHLEALISRSAYIRLNINTNIEKIVRASSIAYDGMFASQGLTQKEGLDVMVFMFENQAKLREISLRMILKLCNLFKADRVKWRTMAQITCLKEN